MPWLALLGGPVVADRAQIGLGAAVAGAEQTTARSTITSAADHTVIDRVGTLLYLQFGTENCAPHWLQAHCLAPAQPAAAVVVHRTPGTRAFRAGR